MSFLVLPVLSAILAFAPTATSKNYPIAKPNCSDRCGNVNIPFPFGLKEGCYLNSDFFINCSISADHPKPLLRHSNINVRNISVEGQLSVMNYVARRCGEGSPSAAWINLSKFYISQTANKFVAVGCDTFATVSGYGDDQSYLTVCMATCNRIEDVQNWTCSGIGCCQTTDIPSLSTNVRFNLTSLKSYGYTSGSVTDCSYAFVVEKEKFNFSSDILTKKWEVEEMPIVIDWMISKDTGSNTSACQGNTTCVPYSVKPDAGYRCACKKGYEGNPYLPPGCLDIDECEDEPCSKNATCKNTEGGYECSCNEGYRGDGKGESGCRLRDECKDNGKGCPSSNGVNVIVLGIALGTIVLLISGFSLYLGFRRRKSMRMKEKFFRENGGLILQQRIAQGTASSGTTRIFTSEQLKSATSNYNQTTIIGRGGFGIVYKGHLLDGRIVAVKKAKMMDPTQVEQFINEVIVLSQINHKNIVKLLGCCFETEVPLLIYEFIENGTLFEHLHNKDKSSALPWPTRLRIATETADVLSYLHSTASPPIIHRDVKSVNILLDNDYTARVSDFGASRLVPQDQTQLTTMVKGTIGYLDPEYIQTHHLTEKSDVYSFGVVLVELLTSRRALSFYGPEEERNLSQHFLSLLKENQLFKILDDNIVCEGNIEELQEVALLAKRCLNVKGEDRPTMKEVVVKLEGLRSVAKHSSTHDLKTSPESEVVLSEPPISIGHDDFSVTTIE